MKPDGRALRFDAVEELSVDEVAFSWRANAHVAPLVSMHVVDQFHAATGSLSGRLFGIPVVRARGPEVDEALPGGAGLGSTRRAFEPAPAVA